MKHFVLVNPSQGFNTWCIPLGLCSISAYLKKHYLKEELKVTLLDAHCQDIYKDFVMGDIYAVTAVTQDIDKAIKFAEFVKFAVGRYCPVILGGVHITTYRKLPEPFDVGVIGEGEVTVLELMNKPITEWHNINGICYNNNGTTHFTNPRTLAPDLDVFPIPDRDISNMDYYLQPRQLIPYYTGRTLTLVTSRGCNFNCVFCSTHIHWQKFRAFSAERVIEEIEQLIDNYQVENIHIVDDLFISDKKRFAEIHRMIIEKSINKKINFMCLLRSDMLDNKTMQMLKEMNVVVTGIGMESGCPKTLKYLKHNTTTVTKNRMAIELSGKYGIPTMGSFMIGNPYEMEEEIMQTLKFIQDYRYNPYLTALIYISVAYPGTQFWEYAKENGLPEGFDNIIMDFPDNIAALKNGVLLTDIPIDKFWEIVKLFQKEMDYSAVKRHLYRNATLINYIKAYGIGMLAEKNPITGIIETTKIALGCRKYRKAAEEMFVPIRDSNPCNRILMNGDRKLYLPVILQMCNYAPKMMSRKIPEANVQQAFVLNTVYNLIVNMESPKILCVGSFEDTTAASLKAIGYRIEEIDPSINYDLDFYCKLSTTGKGSYDIIFSTSVLEHVQDDKLFIQEIAILLKPNGTAILTCDFNNRYRVDDKLPSTDFRFYTDASLKELITFAHNCTLVDEPIWSEGYPDFVYEKISYSFASLVFRKDVG